jgi:RHS repeat-associated protein
VSSNSYLWNAESEIKTAGGLNYSYDGDGDRVEKSNGKIYWYGAGTQVLDESDGSGNITDEYVYFGGKRVAHRVVSGNSVYYYAEDLLGSSRALATSAGGMCYDADFYAYGGEHDYTNTCAQNYKFTGKERDPETNNDDFDARYYSSAYGRFLSADWSSTPSPVPYANLTNPQTLNLYAMVSDNPESFADLDGHFETVQTTPGTCAAGGSQSCEEQEAAADKTCPECLDLAEDALQFLEDTPAGQEAEKLGSEAIAEGTALLTAAAAAGGNAYPSYYHGEFNDASGAFTLMKSDQGTKDQTATGPKAADATGQTAGGQATDKYGNKLGPSKKPQVNQTDHSTEKAAKDAARQQGNGTPDKHPRPQKGDPHYHPTDKDGKKIQNSTHHNYPD